MIEKQLPQLNHLLGENRILFCFSGPFHQELIEELGRAIQGYVRQSDEPSANQQLAFRNIFAVFIEQSQNIKRYLESLADPAAERSGIVVIGRDNNQFFVESGNKVRRDHVPELRSRLEQLQHLDKEALKRLYKETIRSERTDASAGLGFIDMARKAAAPLDFSFTPVDEQFEFFSLSVTL
ncbi:SiaB family protein kinase [Spirochaeta africana]|uniref:Uncharacterized protein n=1 Tax=Spirochaeta africana (strain ATCC 700263 / DSM 8902 / Z-7692) TaxID=889378 RepID=H9UMJ2_SPIAZ|nr:SiaB family protein kinase [Spirochaeta africana]AFG38735.1 hypothetical protein Spiaf_2710 [Spirochaeta africana DSM 8902]